MSIQKNGNFQNPVDGAPNKGAGSRSKGAHTTPNPLNTASPGGKTRSGGHKRNTKRVSGGSKSSGY